MASGEQINSPEVTLATEHALNVLTLSVWLAVQKIAHKCGFVQHREARLSHRTHRSTAFNSHILYTKNGTQGIKKTVFLSTQEMDG